ncbi:MAG: winged helix DNA-binding domain-containing protein [Clostridia bacterium]|nr:winged helix DNA-binding domain-containing protein [Clostridia bacterium]
MDQGLIAAQHINRLLCRDAISVGDMLGLQSQFLRYSKYAAKVRGIDLDTDPGKYFRAWTLRGTMHIHALDDYPLYMHAGNRSAYMKEYWDDYSVISPESKAKAEDRMLRLIEAGIIKRKDIVRSFLESGTPKATMDYLFNAWGGLPRILMERGEIIQTVSDDLSYAFAPKVPVMAAEQAEREQMKRYLENYAPCSVSDAVYFFRYAKSKAKRLMEKCVSGSSGMLTWKDGFVYKDPEAVCDPKATNAIFVLPGFDPLLLGYEKKENAMIPPEHLREVYNLQGIIKPVILHKGQCIATWTVRKNTAYIKPFQADNKAACERAKKQILELTQCDGCRYE